MNKTIAFIVLLTSAILIYLYSDQQTENSSEETTRQIKQKTSETPLFSLNESRIKEKIPIKIKNINKDKLPLSSIEKIINKDNQYLLMQSEPYSYPIEDADLYYIPPEERHPGNLGGPPPLKIPNH